MKYSTPWDWTEPLKIGPVHGGSVRALASVSLPGGRTLVISGSSDRTIRRWDATTGEPIGDPLTGHAGRVRALATATLPDSRTLIISGSSDGAVRRWDATTGQPIGDPLTGHFGRVRSLTTATLPDGQLLIISGGEDRTIRRWDAATGQPIGDPLTGHTGAVWSLTTAIPRTGHAMIISGSDDRTIRRWDATTGQPIDTPLAGHTGGVRALTTATLPDRPTLIISGSNDHTIRRWDATTGQPIGDPLTGHTDTVRSLTPATSPDGQTLIISGSNDRTQRRWDAATGLPIGGPLTGHNGGVWALTTATLANGRTLVVSGSDDRTIRRWDATTGRRIGDPWAGHTDTVWALASATRPDGQTLIISGDGHGAVRRWDATTGQPVRPSAPDAPPLRHIVTGHTDTVWALTSTAGPDGRTLVISGSGDRTIRRWDATTGEPVGKPLIGHTQQVLSLTTATLPDGRTLVISASSDRTIRRWDATTGEPVGNPLVSLIDRCPLSATTLADGRTLIISGSAGSTVRRWDATTGEPIGDPLTGHTSIIWSLATATLADGRTLIISGSGDRTIRRWDATTGAPIGEPLTGHTDGVLSLTTVTLDDGRTLIISGGLDTTVRRWDATTGQPIGDPLAGHSGAVWALTSAVLPDGRRLVISGGYDWALVWWPVLPSGQVAGEVTPPPVTDAVSRVDDTDDASFRDVLGRGVLAAHLEELLAQLTSKHRAETAVVHVDGRWGSGKSRLVTLLEQRLGGAAAQSEARLHKPVMIRYDAWRESAVAPEWWSVATAINRAVRRERAVAARVAMTLASAVTRIARSVPVLVSAAGLAAVLLARLSGAWSGDVKGLGTALTVLTAVATVGLAAGRVFFWSAPAFGRLHLRTDDNPLGEIAAVVAALRRWSPREGSAWAALRFRRPRRPLLLVIDDLDRCAAQRVVKLLETVHTLLRERPGVRLFPRWRRAAALVVLVLGDGRWVRCSFEKVYEDFHGLGSDVHGLGADFLQKLFDHVVLVPALSADQVQAYVDDVTEVSPWAISGRRRRATARHPEPDEPTAGAAVQAREAGEAGEADGLPDTAAGGRRDSGTAAAEGAPETRRAEALIASAAPGQVYGARVRAAIDQAPRHDQQRLAEEVAAKAASKENVAAFSEHLLAGYAPLMPANPRLVTRVANTFGMLMALRLHVGHREPQDYVARAAIMFVRFPTLVDQLLSDPDPPELELPGRTPAAPPHRTEAASIGKADAASRQGWLRRDVQQVLRDENGQLVDAVRLARCFGREYPPPAPSPDPQPAALPAAVVQPDGEASHPAVRDHR